MDFEDLVTAVPPPKGRVGKSDGPVEHHLYEGAVMLAYAMHLLRTEGARDVRIHPDGEHAKQFDFSGWLQRHDFTKNFVLGSTPYGGEYHNPAGQTITVRPKSGEGDVVAEVEGRIIWAECKSGIINTRHSGQLSKLRRGLCEAVGQLMARPPQGRQVAVVPQTESTLRLATQFAPRCKLVGIEIAVVDRHGEVMNVKPEATGEQT